MKTLIISHNPLTTYESMGKTLSGLFYSFSTEELCQLYIYPTIPNNDKCHSFFRITDKEVLHSFFFKRIKGKVVSPVINNFELYENFKDKQFYTNKRSQGLFRLFVRDLMWKFSFWFSRELKIWIEKEKPDIIFLAAGMSKFIYDICFKICKKYKLKVVSYICDDYYFSPKNMTLLSRTYYKYLKKKIDKLMTCSSCVIFICQEMEKKYSQFFNLKNHFTIMTPYTKLSCENVVQTKIKEFNYFGNIRLGRYQCLYEIGVNLEKYNRINKTNIKLNIYSPETDSQILSLFNKVDSIVFKGFVTGDEYEEAYNKTQCFVHCESFENEYKNLTRFSISTKIPDVLSSGKPLLMYGPSNIACTSYLNENNAAFLCMNKEDLFDKISQLVSGKAPVKIIVKNAIRTARINHSLEYNSLKLKNIITNCV